MPITVDETTTEAVRRASSATWYGSIVAVVIIAVLALVARWIWHRFVRRTTTHVHAVSRYPLPDRRQRVAARARLGHRALPGPRHAVAGLLISVGTFVIVSVAILFALSAVGSTSPRCWPAQVSPVSRSALARRRSFATSSPVSS